MHLYGISGLGADQRVFKYLNLDCDLIPIKWINPLNDETVEDYSERLAQVIDKDKEFGVLGVSFGGSIAVEISKKLNPKLSILISTVETREELKTIYKLIGKSKICKVLPQKFFDPPRLVANWIFGAKEKELLRKILDDTDLKFAKWAVNELMNWKNRTKLSNRVLKIAGTNDKLISPSHNNNNQRLIIGGEHFMIVDKAYEISQIINEELEKLTTNRG